GTRGIGNAICDLFLEKGATVIAIATSEERNKEWVESKKALGFKNVDAYAADVSDFDACQKVITSIKGKYNHVDILVNNAGVCKDASFKNMKLEDWQKVMKIDLDSLFNVTNPVVKMMLETGFGRIINMSSVNGQKGQFGQTNYSAAKAGVHGFTKALALELAKKNITVNTISPGYINTDMMSGISEDILKSIEAQIPVGRLGKAEEIAALVAFLAAENSGYMTGANFSINGGLHMY
ncbi:MAG: acetoacetyl-CoA reductase, partial [Candidatus Margulisiibacteriota bacterium]